MSPAFFLMRERIVAAILANPALSPESAALLDQTAGSGADQTFEALKLDSLARMELCLHFECEFGILLSSGHLDIHPSINALADFLASGT